MAACVECGGRRLSFASARSAVSYTGTVPTLVRAWKERGLRRLGPVAADLVAEVVPCPAADVITYVPPDGDRSLKRGCHPAAELARELSVRWGLDSSPLLARTRQVARQTGLSLGERRGNVRGAFVATGRLSARVVLVDDVYTTGATVAAAASALRGAGTRSVDVVTFARAVR